VSPFHHTQRQDAGEEALQGAFCESEGGEKWQAGSDVSPASPEPLHAAPVRRTDHADAGATCSMVD
jgi:hypothetical protein